MIQPLPNLPAPTAIFGPAPGSAASAGTGHSRRETFIPFDETDSGELRFQVIEAGEDAPRLVAGLSAEGLWDADQDLGDILFDHEALQIFDEFGGGNYFEWAGDDGIRIRDRYAGPGLA